MDAIQPKLAHNSCQRVTQTMPVINGRKTGLVGSNPVFLHVLTDIRHDQKNLIVANDLMHSSILLNAEVAFRR